MRQVTLHKTNIDGDVNNGYHIEPIKEGVGGAATGYAVMYPGMDHTVEQLHFHTLDRNGLTNEILLAIVIDRLEGFQSGPCACEENSSALSNIRSALAALQVRTQRRLHQGIEGQMTETTKQASDTSKARVRDEGDKLVIDNIKFGFGDLKQWSAWSLVEKAVKSMSPAITAYELSVIESIVPRCGSGGQNGFTELKSALATTSKA